MAKSHGLGQAFYAHGYDVSGDVGAITTAKMARALLGVAGVDRTAHERLNGHADGELAFNCFFNDATDQAHDAFSTLPTADRLLMWLFSTTPGDPVLCQLSKQVNYDFNRGEDAALLGSVQGLASGYGLEDARLLKAKGTHASATDETGILADGGAQTVNGGIGFLEHFSAASGTVEYDIEDSSDSTDGIDGAWANLLAFTDVATPWAATAQRVEVTGAVEKWVRCSTNGTFTTAVLAMAFRRGLTVDDIDRT